MSSLLGNNTRIIKNVSMVSRDQRDPLAYSAPKSKEKRNKILAQVNTKDSGER